MPIPNPGDDESESDFVGRCVSQLTNEDPEMSQAQAVAICFDTYRKAKQGEKMEDIKRDEDGHIIVAENVKIRFSGDMNFIGESSEDKEEDDKDDEEQESE